MANSAAYQNKFTKVEARWLAINQLTEHSDFVKGGQAYYNNCVQSFLSKINLAFIKTDPKFLEFGLLGRPTFTKCLERRVELYRIGSNRQSIVREENGGLVP